MAIIKRDVYPIEANDFSSAGFASSRIKRSLKELGIAPAIVRMVAISSYEAELNMIIHSQGGEMILEIEEDGLRIICKDRGPGIPDIDKAMQEGYSTASDQIRTMGFGAGMGLPNIKRNSHDFSIESKVGEGTVITACYRF